MASATSVNGLSITKASSSNLGLILGISIPLLILCTFINNYSYSGGDLLHLQKQDRRKGSPEHKLGRKGVLK